MRTAIATLIISGFILAMGVGTNNSTVMAQSARQYVWTSRQSYAVGEQIVVRFSGLAGGRYDVIEILHNGRGISGYWQYTKSRRSGYVTFRGLQTGTYDARVRFVVNGRSYSDVYRFTVGYNGNGGSNAGTSRCGLGSNWNVIDTSGSWRGVWTRRGNSNTFDAVWTHPVHGRHTAVLTISLSGSQVSIYRRDRLGNCTYRGTVAADGLNVTGTVRCSWDRNTYNWQATIGCANGGWGNGEVNPPQEVCGNYNLGQAIKYRWMQLGGSRSVLGCPVMNESRAGRSPQRTDGSYIRFRNGFLVLHATGRYRGRVFAVHGPAYNLYSGMAGSNSWLGFPISDVYRVNGGERINFEGGYIFTDARTGRAQAYRYR